VNTKDSECLIPRDGKQTQEKQRWLIFCAKVPYNIFSMLFSNYTPLALDAGYHHAHSDNDSFNTGS